MFHIAFMISAQRFVFCFGSLKIINHVLQVYREDRHSQGGQEERKDRALVHSSF